MGSKISDLAQQGASNIKTGVGGAFSPPAGGSGMTDKQKMMLAAGMGLLRQGQGQMRDIGGGYQMREQGNPVLGALEGMSSQFEKSESERKKKLEKEADRKYAEEQKRVQNVLSNYKDQERNRFAAEQSQLTRDASAEQAALGRAERGRVADRAFTQGSLEFDALDRRAKQRLELERIDKTPTAYETQSALDFADLGAGTTKLGGMLEGMDAASAGRWDGVEAMDKALKARPKATSEVPLDILSSKNGIVQKLTLHGPDFKEARSEVERRLKAGESEESVLAIMNKKYPPENPITGDRMTPQSYFDKSNYPVD